MWKIFLSLFFVAVFGFSQTITLKANSWKLAGTPYDVAVSSLGLGNGDVIWSYDSGKWSVYVKGNSNYQTLSTIKGGSGFWIVGKSDENISINSNQTKNRALVMGWNLVSTPEDKNASYFNSSVKYIWTYRDGKWYLYDGTTKSYNDIKKLITLKANEGAWIYYLDPDNSIMVGNTPTALSDGNFSKVDKQSSDDVENIWNISFKVKSLNTQAFNIGIKFKKIATGAMGEVVFKDLKITDGSISSPSYIIIHGIKSNGDEGETNYNSGDIVTNSVSMSNGVVTLKLGYVMKKQTVVSDTKFKAISNYLVQIASSSDIIDNSKPISIGKLTSFLYDFDNSNGIEGYIEIH